MSVISIGAPFRSNSSSSGVGSHEVVIVGIPSSSLSRMGNPRYPWDFPRTLDVSDTLSEIISMSYAAASERPVKAPGKHDKVVCPSGFRAFNAAAAQQFYHNMSRK